MYGMVKNDSSDADRIAQAVMDIDHLYKKWHSATPELS